MNPNLYRSSLLFVLFVIGLMGCNSGKSADSRNTCQTEGEVKDFTGLDGCQLMIVTQDGKKLLPGKILDQRVALEAGLKIRFGYRPIDMMSVCMNEDMIVEITCLEAIK